MDKPTKVIRYILYYFTFIVAAITLEAQVPCTQILEQAQEAYESGDLLRIPQQIGPCVEQDGFTKEEEIRAKKLSTLVYIFVDNIAASEQAMVDFLRTDPEHQLDPVSDPKELFYLYYKFRTKPIFRIRGSIFSNYTLVRTHTPFGVENLLQNLEQPQSSFLGGMKIAVEKEILSFMEFSSGARISLRNFKLTNPIFDYSQYDLSESQTSIDIPLSLRFLSYTNRRAQPYLAIGWAPSFLIGSNLTGERQGGQTVNLGGQDLLDIKLRNSFNHYAFASAGIRFRFRNRREFIFLECMYQRGLSNMSNANDRYSPKAQELLFRLGYVDNDFYLDMVQLNFGYIRSFYKPKKLKNYKRKREITGW